MDWGWLLRFLFDHGEILNCFSISKWKRCRAKEFPSQFFEHPLFGPSPKSLFKSPWQYGIPKMPEKFPCECENDRQCHHPVCSFSSWNQPLGLWVGDWMTYCYRSWDSPFFKPDVLQNRRILFLFWNISRGWKELDSYRNMQSCLLVCSTSFKSGNLRNQFSKLSFTDPHRKLIWQWIHRLKMYFLLNMVIFQCHVRFQSCKWKVFLGVRHWLFLDPRNGAMVIGMVSWSSPLPSSGTVALKEFLQHLGIHYQPQPLREFCRPSTKKHQALPPPEV